jgi:hypothetical protein
VAFCDGMVIAVYGSWVGVEVAPIGWALPSRRRAMRLNGVEIKVSLSNQQDDSAVDRAVEVLELGGAGQPRSIGFIEDTTVGVRLPLFHQGVVLRVREVEDGDDDSTVKLRPCRRSQLTESWLGAEKGDGWKFRVEEDWAGSRRALAASCVADLPRRRIAAAREGKEPVGRLFTGGQWRFLSDCIGMPINLDALTLLPPVKATRWEKVRVQEVETVVVERWTINELDFLELSIRKDTVEEAREARAELERAILALGLEGDDEQVSKTERVLAYLVGLEP